MTHLKRLMTMSLIPTKDPEFQKYPYIELIDREDLKRVALMFGYTCIFLFEEKNLDYIYITKDTMFYVVSLRKGGLNGATDL